MENKFYTRSFVQNLRGFVLGLMLINSFMSFGQTTETFTTTGASTWTCPAGVTSLKVECWGAGGGGGAATNVATRVGGGGGGGSYVTNIITVVPGTVYNITVGAGGLTPSTSAVTAYGSSGGKSEFSGGSVTTITASGGTGGGGGTGNNTSAGTNTITSAGGKLGGIYGYGSFVGGTGTYSNASSYVTISGGGGSGATAGIATSGGLVANVVSGDQGTGYTSAPTVTITTVPETNGSGATATALFNPDIDAGGTVIKGGNGAAGFVGISGGAGGNGGNGGAGGATNSTVGAVGAVGIAPGGGGAGGYANSTPASARGGIGGKGQVVLTYTANLPVELANFQVNRTSKSALLSWITYSEKDNAYFGVEHSINGIEFQSIGQIKGNGTSIVSKTYKFEHLNPLVGVNYYRLKQVDYDGTSNYSPIQSVTMGKTGFIVKTTLVQDALDVVVSDETSTPLPSGSGSTISIFNMSGQQVFTAKVQGAQQLNISNLPAGLYVIRSGTGDVARFVKGL
jgi:Secretion system C-terminal sorting domain